jgi:hypothetical protein
MENMQNNTKDDGQSLYKQAIGGFGAVIGLVAVSTVEMYKSAIVAIIVGFFGLVMVIAGIFVCYVYRKK